MPYGRIGIVSLGVADGLVSTAGPAGVLLGGGGTQIEAGGDLDRLSDERRAPVPHCGRCAAARTIISFGCPIISARSQPNSASAAWLANRMTPWTSMVRIASSWRRQSPSSPRAISLWRSSNCCITSAASSCSARRRRSAAPMAWSKRWQPFVEQDGAVITGRHTDVGERPPINGPVGRCGEPRPAGGGSGGPRGYPPHGQKGAERSLFNDLIWSLRATCNLWLQR